MKRLSKEEIRYKVPGVCNRFWQVHKGILFLCVFLMVSILLLTALVVHYRKERTMKTDPVLVVCCLSASEEDRQYLQKRYGKHYSEIVFLRYDEAYASDEKESKRTLSLDGDRYDFTAFSSALKKKDISVEDCVCFVLRSDRKAVYACVTYEDLSLEKGKELSVAQIATAIERAG